MLAITPQPMSNAKKENIGNNNNLLISHVYNLCLIYREKKGSYTNIFVKHTPKHFSLQTTNDTEQEVTPLLYFNIKLHFKATPSSLQVVNLS